jgi:DNA modification methylase
VARVRSQRGAEAKMSDVPRLAPTRSVKRLGPWDLDRVHPVDCSIGLAALPADCLDVVVTSPPYWGQRGNPGLGSEADPRDYLAHLVDILAESMRCLRPSGTLWCNLGDAYNTPVNWRASDHVYSSLGSDGAGLPATNAAYTKDRGRRRACVRDDVAWLRYGNLLALPYRVVLAMCDRGHLFRGEVVWKKSRPMPEGRCRRPHRRHEGIYVFAKDERHQFRIDPPVGSVWELRQTPNRTTHDATFPIDLPLACVGAASVAGPSVVVCDPFMGSGTTARAARARPPFPRLRDRPGGVRGHRGEPRRGRIDTDMTRNATKEPRGQGRLPRRRSLALDVAEPFVRAYRYDDKPHQLYSHIAAMADRHEPDPYARAEIRRLLDEQYSRAREPASTPATLPDARIARRGAGPR